MTYQAKEFLDFLSPVAPNDAMRRWPEIFLGEGDRLSFDVLQRVNLLCRYAREWQALVAEGYNLCSQLGWRTAA